jgi:hypothetical protein
MELVAAWQATTLRGTVNLTDGERNLVLGSASPG